MSNALEILLAKQEITEQLYTYCRAFDRIDDDLARTVWHEGGTVQYSNRPVETFEAFLAFSTPNRRKLNTHTHVITNILIKVDGDVAYSESYGVSFGQDHPNEDKVASWIWCGRYEDRWSWRNGRWAIEHRQYIPDAYARAEAPEAWSRGVIPGVRRRDPTDPSYALFAGRKLEEDAAGR